MLGDSFLQVASAQAVTATAVSASSVDMLAARDIGAGKPIRAVFNCSVTAASGGTTTVQFQIIVADDAALTSNVTVIGDSGPLDKSVLVANQVQPVVTANQSMTSALALGKRYLGVRFVVNTTNLTAGTFSAKFALDSDATPKAYPSGYTV